MARKRRAGLKHKGTWIGPRQLDSTVERMITPPKAVVQIHLDQLRAVRAVRVEIHKDYRGNGETIHFIVEGRGGATTVIQDVGKDQVINAVMLTA